MSGRKPLNQPGAVIGVAFVLLLLLAVAPIMLMVFKTLLDPAALSILGGIFIDSRQIGLILNSLGVAVSATAIAVLLGVVTAFLIAKSDVPCAAFWRVATLLPLLIPPYLSALVWQDILRAQGPVNTMLQALLHLDSPVVSPYGSGGVILVLGMSYFPFVSLFVQSGLSSLNPRLEEVGLLSGGTWMVLRRVTAALVLPNIAGGALFVFVLSIVNYGVPSLLQLNVFPVEIFVQFSAYYNIVSAVAMCLPLLTITLLLVLMMRRALGRRPFLALGIALKSKRMILFGNYRHISTAVLSLITIVSVLLPLVAMVVKIESPASVWQAWRTGLGAIVTSLVLSTISATSALCIGFVLAYFIQRRRGMISSSADYLSILPFAFPGVVLGLGLISLWNRAGLHFVYGSSAILVVGYIALVIPYVVRILSAGIATRVSYSVEEAVQLTTSSWWTRMYRVVLPLCAPNLLAAWALAYLLCVYELGLSILVAPPGITPLSVRVYTLLHYGAGQIVNSLAVTSVILGLIPVVLLWLFARWLQGVVKFA
ncbi:MAG: hypothetical protein ABIK83_13755 [Candidatus Zixiibacteriota bacterium]